MLDRNLPGITTCRDPESVACRLRIEDRYRLYVGDTAYLLAATTGRRGEYEIAPFGNPPVFVDGRTYAVRLARHEAPILHLSAETVAGCAGEDVEVPAGGSAKLGGDCRFWGGLNVRYRWHRVERHGVVGSLSPPNP